jgi:hypothetical protein
VQEFSHRDSGKSDRCIQSAGGDWKIETEVSFDQLIQVSAAEYNEMTHINTVSDLSAQGLVKLLTINIYYVSQVLIELHQQ